MATYELNETQFITFLEYTWNTHLDWYENLFHSILAYEESRTFSEGWQYCKSSLTISIQAPDKYTKRWEYTTTSGTELRVINCDYDNIGDVYEVTIPDERDQPGRTAHSDMQAVLAGHAYWSWAEQQDESNPLAIAAAAFFRGVTVESLLESRKKEEEEREEEKENRRQFYSSNSDSDYEEFEGIIADDSIES